MKTALPTSRPDRWSNGAYGPNREALALLLQRSAEQLFDTLSIDAVDGGPFNFDETRWQTPVSILPFTGSEVAGSLLLAAPFEVMGQTTPSGDQDLEALADWSRELANLLAGSLKTGLLRQGIMIELGVPVSMLGTEVRVALPAATPIGLLFECKSGALHIGLDAYVADAVVVHAPAEQASTFAVLLFED